MRSSDMLNNLIINYIPPSLQEDDLRNLFMAFGKIESCKLMMDKHTRQSLGYGFVKYSTEEAADKAIAAMSGKEIEGKRLKVSHARPSSSDIKRANLYVARLDPHLNKEDLEKIFSPYGTVIEVKILTDRNTGESRGVGFVRFDTQAQAEAAMGALNGVQLPNMSQPIIVKFADSTQDKLNKRQNTMQMYQVGGQYRYAPYANMYDGMGGVAPLATYNYGAPALQAPQGYCLFIYNIPPTSNETLLTQLFTPYGAILSVKVIRDIATGHCKGYGFVNFLKLEDAQQAILHLNGCQMGDKILQVSFKTQGKVKSN
eukprot:CAMPEP_0174252460 /NCGR_PEP_ID=MMETSP0439-20130205/1920_1 /TAXON_ID=0 /ORGANISM="Stereomyxa ramosa, Strain Chinc5" /LENGTH=313 /DNA_ID=CAMNT_0015332997 /DNA_START=67 /DNA_END=1008 /DNA_ORIENTATION=-